METSLTLNARYNSCEVAIQSMTWVNLEYEWNEGNLNDLIKTYPSKKICLQSFDFKLFLSLCSRPGITLFFDCMFHHIHPCLQSYHILHQCNAVPLRRHYNFTKPSKTSYILSSNLSWLILLYFSIVHTKSNGVHILISPRTSLDKSPSTYFTKLSK